MDKVQDNKGHSKETQAPQGSPKYWLSLDQWRNDPKFQELANNEFISSPLSSEEGQGGWARREFLKLMGASMALTSFGCVRKAQKIVPYVKRPNEVVQGITNYYASSFVDAGEVFGVVVSTREGRPIKVEGNTLHPANEGGMSARAHAHVLKLYDPDRLTAPKKLLFNDKKSNYDVVSASWENLDKEVVAALKKKKVALLTSSVQSPSTEALLKEFRSSTGAQHFVWDGVDLSATVAAQSLAYGTSGMPHYRIDKADLILAVGTDFLGTFMSPTEFTRAFSKGRKPDGKMNRLVVAEAGLSLTGANADDRWRVKPSEQLGFVVSVLESVLAVGGSRYAQDKKVKAFVKKHAKVPSSVTAEEIAHLAKELWAHRGASLVLANGMEAQTQASLTLAVAANLLNTVLGNDGVTVDYAEGSTGFSGGRGHVDKLYQEIEKGNVKTLIIHGCNPAATLPDQQAFADHLKKVDLVIYTGDRIDETGRLAQIVAPDHHSLEAWSDAEARRGVYSVQQPTIAPLYDTRAFQDSLLGWLKALGAGSSRVKSSDSFLDYIKSYWKSVIFSKKSSKSSFEDRWYSLLQEGVFVTSQGDAKRKARSFNVSRLANLPEANVNNGLELSLYSTVGLRDGSLANVSWLQEFPDPVTKVCWDNYLNVSPALAMKKHWKTGQIVELKVGDETRHVPVHVQPGQHDDVVSLAVGYGRQGAGEVANGVGVEAFGLAQALDGHMVYSGLSVDLKPTKKSIELANVQGHHSMEGRQIVVEATVNQYQKNKSANIHKHKVFSAWSKHEYKGRKWGMTIDLSSCTGCSACVVACQSENNIPVVGKKYVLQGREMHWIRIDRYYVGTPENPSSVHQPITCQHCDNAPCETVCPVLATVHSDEGTNDMIYNRCVGTRYCANNCPYKVRRFNWFSYRDMKAPLHMALNPEVTARHRGVMEKCTFCSHRIKAKDNELAYKKKKYQDGDVVSACQQSCPTGAITFGDLNDPNSRVSKEFGQERSYALLEELNAQPAIRYQTKVRNTQHLKTDGKAHHGEEHHS